MKSLSFFKTSFSKRLEKVLSKNFDLQLFSEDPFKTDQDLYLPPGRICLICEDFSQDGGINFAKYLISKYEKLIIILCIKKAVTNEIVRKAVTQGHVYRIFSEQWPEQTILSALNDAFQFSQEIKKNIYLLREEEDKKRKLEGTQQSLKNEEFMKVESLMYADQIVQYAKSSIESYNQILSAIGSGKRSKELLDSIREKINRLVPVDAISLCFRSKRISSSEKLNISLSYMDEEHDKKKLLDVSKEFYDHIVSKLTPDRRNKVTNYMEQAGVSTLCEIINQERVASSLIIPLIHQGKYMGNLVLFRFGKPVFKKRELLIVEHFSETGNIIARGFRNFEYFEKTKKEWESTFDAISDPVSIVDLNFNLIRVNRAFVKTSKFTINKVVGEKCYEVLAGIKRPCVGCPMKQSVQEREVSTCDELRVSGNRVYNVWSYPLVKSDKEIQSVVMYYRDVTQEKILTQQLMNADKMAEIGILAGSVAHEINNPLGGIFAFTQIILKELENEKQQETQFYKDLKDIETAAVRGKKIVENLLSFSRMSKSEEFFDIKIDSVIQTAISLIQYNAKLANINFEVSVEKKIPTIYGNNNQLLQVFLSILSNSMKTINKAKGVKKNTIHVRVFYNNIGNMVCIEIQDFGKRMSKEERSKLFNPTDLVDNKGSTLQSIFGAKRIGVGLSISYGIVQDHNGKIEVTSSSKMGNKYILQFPVSTGERINKNPFKISLPQIGSGEL